ncbi:MAG: phosphohistidine phosphatase SixA [Thaumarchaeota archaeon]|nr:phosphohistidine phosphatase SixA [Nitrososphaerota archaeon]
MEVYLVRHGEAKLEHEDPEKSLSDNGRSDISIIADYVSTLGLRISKIYHSEKLRAKQTAEILHQKLKPNNGVECVLGLAPSDDIKTALKIIEDAKEPIMIVSHLPYLGRLLSMLVTGNQNYELVKFGEGSIICIEEEDDHWLIRWSLRRDLIRS